MVEVGKLEQLSLYEAFNPDDKKNPEAQEFTPWLCDNIKMLGEVLQLEISEPQREQLATSMRVDILAYVGPEQNERIAIENQFGSSDHSHLGQLISYVAHFETKYAVWVVEKARDEHIEAVRFLNSNNSQCYFFLVEVTAYRIDNSRPAPVFNIVAKPEYYERLSDDGVNQEPTQAEKMMMHFWAQFLPTISSSLKPQAQSWMEFGKETQDPKTHIAIVVRKNTSYIQYVFFSKDKEWNKARFDKFYTYKDEIQKAFGYPLEWRKMENNRASFITYYLPVELGGYEQMNYSLLNTHLAQAYRKFKSIMVEYLQIISREERLIKK